MLHYNIMDGSSRSSQKKTDVARAIKEAFSSLEQDIMSEYTFRTLMQDVIEHEIHYSYTILLRLWEEHGYIRIVRMPGQPRYVELGSAFERDYPCLM